MAGIEKMRTYLAFGISRLYFLAAVRIQVPAGMTIETCVGCGITAPLPVSVCKRCKEGFDENGNPAFVVYCETVCCIRDENNHERLCKDSNTRKQLYRAGNLLQAMFLKFREATYDVKLVKAVKKGEMLHVYEGGYTAAESGPLYDFPQNLASGRKDQAKLLTFCACEDAVAFIHELSEILLKRKSYVPFLRQ